MSSNSEEKKKRWRHFELVCALIISSIMLILLASPVAFGYYYKTRFFPNTTVAGINVSGLKLDESKTLLNQRYGDSTKKKLSIGLVDKTYSFLLSEAGITLDWHTPLNQTFANQRSLVIWRDGLNLIKTTIQRKNTNESISLIVDNKQLDTKLVTMLKDVNREPVNAQIRVDNDKLVIDKEINGVGVDKSVLESLIKKNIQNSSSNPTWKELKLTFPATSLTPSVSESSLTSLKTHTENLVKNPITLTFEDKKYTFNSQSMLKWIKFNTKDNITTSTLDRTAIDRDVIIIAKKIDIKPVDKLLSSVDGSVMQEGKDGRSVVRTKAVDAIIVSLDSSQTPKPVAADSSINTVPTTTETSSDLYTIAMQVDPKPFETKTAAPPFTPGMYPGKYMEVNLSNQMLYLWEGLAKVKEFRISSGKKSTPTREGIFKIKNKASVGKSYPWIMPWWMAFAQDKTGAWQGFHELPVDMRTGKKEGIGDIGLAVSHGCVRLPIGQSKEVYDWAEVGIPVYIHK